MALCESSACGNDHTTTGLVQRWNQWSLFSKLKWWKALSCLYYAVGIRKGCTWGLKSSWLWITEMLMRKARMSEKIKACPCWSNLISKARDERFKQTLIMSWVFVPLGLFSLFTRKQSENILREIHCGNSELRSYLWKSAKSLGYSKWIISLRHAAYQFWVSGKTLNSGWNTFTETD